MNFTHLDINLVIKEESFTFSMVQIKSARFVTSMPMIKTQSINQDNMSSLSSPQLLQLSYKLRCTITVHKAAQRT